MLKLVRRRALDRDGQLHPYYRRVAQRLSSGYKSSDSTLHSLKIAGQSNVSAHYSVEYPITHAPLVSSRVSLERPGHEICDTWDLWRERWPNPRIVSYPGSDPAPGRKLGWLSADGAPCAIVVPVAIALGTRAIWLSLHTWDGIHWLSVTLGGGSGLRSPGGLYGRR